MNRKEMEQIIKAGGSVVLGGRVIASVEGLPKEAAARPEAPRTRADVEAEITRLQQQLEQLPAEGEQDDSDPDAETKTPRRGRRTSAEGDKD